MAGIDTFDFGHKEIAEAINISVDNARQLYKRAKEKVAKLKHKSVSDLAYLEVAKQFVNHISKGNISELITLFNDDISIIGDGGGKAPAIANPLFGKEQVAQFFFKLIRNKKYSPVFSLTKILSQPAVIIYLREEIVCVQVLSVTDNKISKIYAVPNPDKLTTFKDKFQNLGLSCLI